MLIKINAPSRSTSIAASSPQRKYVKGDRIIVDLDGDVYVATVTTVRQSKVYMKFDDGDTGDLPERSKKILGKAATKRTRKSTIPKTDLPKWLEQTSTTTVKPKRRKPEAKAPEHTRGRKPRPQRVVSEKEMTQGYPVRVNPALTALDVSVEPDIGPSTTNKQRNNKPRAGLTVYERPRLVKKKSK